MIPRVATGDELRSAMRRFPAPICVVTVDFEGDRIGLTVGSLVSLSLEPPLVGISIGNDQAAHALIRGAGAFAAATGRIVSNFLVSETGELTDHELGVLFIQRSEP